jgi:hypothetical protein
MKTLFSRAVFLQQEITKALFETMDFPEHGELFK